MNKKESIIKGRQDFVKRAVNTSKNSNKTIKRLAKRLFLSESTIIKDLYS